MKNRCALSVSLLCMTSLISMLDAGCNATPAAAPKSEVQATSLQKFPKTDIEFHANQFFLWPDNVTPEQVSRVLFLSDEIDRLEREITPLKARLDQLDAELGPTDELIRRKNIELNTRLGRINKRTGDLNLRRQRLDAAQEADSREKAKENPNPAELKRIRDEIANLQKQITPIDTELRTLNQQKAVLEGEILTLNQSEGVLERNRLQPQKRVDEEEKQRNLSEIMSIVTWYDPQPSSVGFHFERQGTIRAWVSQWNLDRREVKNWDFSTEPADGQGNSQGNKKKPTIENLTYSDLGGVFEFDLKVYEDEAQSQLRETYSFRIARTKYDATDGKIYYTGTMNRKRPMPDGTVEIRRGVAKLVDKNN